MLGNYEMIVHKLPRELKGINIYPIGDIHRESPHFDPEAWRKWKSKFASDPFGYLVIVGDAFENALKNSKGNCYRNTMSIGDAKDWFEAELSPFRTRILGGTMGNHEKRSVDITDESPLYDVFCRIGVRDVYREDMAFVKVSLGERNKERQCTYMLTLAHGTSKNKTKNFGYAIDGTDLIITGHTHDPESGFPAKIVIDPHNETVKKLGFKRITVPSFMNFDGYVLSGMYMPQDNMTFPVISLDGTKKNIKVTWE